MSPHSRSFETRIAALGALDEQGIAGSALAPTDFGAGGLAALRWKQLFALPNPAYRHLDLFGRCVCLATEAAGLGAVLPEEHRRATALVLATELGCLQSDLDFARSLEPGERVVPSVFPYTLPSTCLGELAIRHRLQGPLLCLVPGAESDDNSARTGLREAQRLIARGEARAAVVCVGDCLTEERARRVDLPVRVGVASLILVRKEDARTPASLPGNWLESDTPVEALLEALRAEGASG